MRFTVAIISLAVIVCYLTVVATLAFIESLGGME